MTSTSLKACSCYSPPSQVIREKRGFMPKGGGLVRVIVEALGEGRALPCFDLTQRGEVSAGQGRRLRAFTTG